MDGVPDGGDDEEHRREARTGGQRVSGELLQHGFRVGGV